jgi:outer membrane murein-binding lipoprotein Lpp
MIMRSVLVALLMSFAFYTGAMAADNDQGDNQDSVQLKLDALESKADALESKADALESKADDLESSVDALDTKADDLATSVDALDTKLDALSSAVDALSNLLATAILEPPEPAEECPEELPFDATITKQIISAPPGDEPCTLTFQVATGTLLPFHVVSDPTYKFNITGTEGNEMVQAEATTNCFDDETTSICFHIATIPLDVGDNVTGGNLTIDIEGCPEGCNLCPVPPQVFSFSLAGAVCQ